MSTFEVDYAGEMKEAYPEVQSLISAPVLLAETSKGYIGPDWENADPIYIDFQSSFDKPFSSGAILEITSELVRRLEDRGMMGVLVSPHPADIGRRGRDKRHEKSTLRIRMDVAELSNINTRAVGNRITENTENHPVHEWIRKNSPVREEGDVLDKNKLDRYVHWLNRHPGRKVEVDIGSGEKRGKASLDFRVMEDRQWTAFGQLTNTGTENTGETHHRYGFVHNQLTGNDDIFSLDVTTTNKGVDDFFAGSLSYERPLRLGGRTRVRGFWNGSDYTASDVGIAELTFTGSTQHLGLEVTRNIFQSGPFFLDSVTGFSGKNITTRNDFTELDGDVSFLIVKSGIEAERNTRFQRMKVNAQLTGNVNTLADNRREELAELGRADVDKSWKVFRGNATFSQYLEPLIFGYDSWRNPETSSTSVLGNELLLGGRWQWTPDDRERLVPQEQFLAGGFHTVRGYPESAVSGDSGYVATAEYRVHLPRLLPVQSKPPEEPMFGTPFKLTRNQVYGLPDWDLIMSVFVDAGEVTSNDKTPFEEDDTLLGTGIGAELQIKDYFRLEGNWATAQSGLSGAAVEEGDSEFHFLMSLMY